jgi:hypothetical protein
VLPWLVALRLLQVAWLGRVVPVVTRAAGPRRPPVSGDRTEVTAQTCYVDSRYTDDLLPSSLLPSLRFLDATCWAAGLRVTMDGQSESTRIPGAAVRMVSVENVALRTAGHAGDPASTENGRVYYLFWAEIPEQLFQPFPIVRFVDQHGNLYYSLRGHTWRFPQSTDPSSAAVQIDKWIRTGPRPDGPDA